MSSSIGVATNRFSSLRFSLDEPRCETHFPLSSEFSAITNELTLSELPVNEAVTPDIEMSVSRAAHNLQVDRKCIDVFVHASPNIQAFCLPFSTERCILRLASSLVSLLSNKELSFVIGHELGHFIFGHAAYSHSEQLPSFESAISEKYREISCDRLGLLACGSLNDSVSSLLKSSSGLPSSLLNLNIPEYLASLNQFNSNEWAGFDGSLISHPPLMIRCRALLWFSGALGTSLNLSNLQAVELADINHRIENELSKFVDIHASRYRKHLVDSYRFWFSVYLIAAHGTFTSGAQERFSLAFGSKRLNQVKELLASSSTEDVNELIQGRLSETARKISKDFPRSSDRLFQSIKHDVFDLSLTNNS